MNMLREQVATSLGPIKDATVPGHWVVYVRRTVSGGFVVFVAKNFFRQLPLKNLPIEIKEKLALIHSIDEAFLDEDGMPPEFLIDVGWRLRDEGWYQLVLSENLLNELKGSVS